MRTKINYHIDRMDFDPMTGKYDTTIRFRSAEITVTGKTEEEVENAFDSLVNYVHSNSDFRFTMDAQELTERNNMFSMTDYVEVSDKDEYNEIKELYTAWKESLKAQPVQEIATEQPAVEVVEVVAEQNENTESTPVTETKTENTIRTADLEQIDVDDLLDRTVTIQTNRTTYTGKIIDVNRTKRIAWIETIEDIYEVPLAKVLKLSYVTENQNSIIEQNPNTLSEQQPVTALAKNIIQTQLIKVEIINQNYSQNSTEIKILEGQFQNKYAIISKDDIIFKDTKT